MSFPLKENTKEKIISCPLDDCGIKTNIWERLKLIQKLKKDFASAKEEFKKNDVSMAKDILKLTIDEWDRIILRPYRLSITPVNWNHRIWYNSMSHEVWK